MAAPESWLSESDEVRATKMREHIEDFWGGRSDDLIYTPHDPSHFMRVEHMIQHLVPKERWHLLSDRERMVLTWCSWTHDIGMNQKCHFGDRSSLDIREAHVDASSRWVLANAKSLQLTRQEALVISDLIRFHSRKYDLNDCPPKRLCENDYIRSRLLAAYLRLADALEVTQSRVLQQQHSRFPLFHDLVSEKRDEILFHWIKSFVVSGIAINHARQVIEVEFQFPQEPRDPGNDLLTRYVVNEIKEELETVESTLDEGGISSFHDVIHLPPLSIHYHDQEGWPELLPTVLNHLQMAYSPNSTGVARAALASVRAALDENPDEPKLQQRLQQIRGSLRVQLRKRNCHNEVARIERFLDSVQSQLDVDDQGQCHCARAVLEDYCSKFESLFSDKGAHVSGMATTFWESLPEICKQVTERKSWTFLLFGCSETVASVLARRTVGSKLTLLIAEGRPKTKHGPHNTPTYIDAERYAAIIRAKEQEANLEDEAEIYVIPDACVATALDRDREHCFSRVDAVLFGTNGIYMKPPSVAHTVGHYGVTLIANSFETPVIVLASAAKIGPNPGERWWERQRDNTWLTSHHETRKHIEEKCMAQTGWNPREEHVPIQLLSAIVTEVGSFRTQSTAPDDPMVGSTLKQWSEQVDKLLESESN